MGAVDTEFAENPFTDASDSGWAPLNDPGNLGFSFALYNELGYLPFDRGKRGYLLVGYNTDR